MNSRHLFLFGGSPPFTSNLGKRFAEISLNGEGRVAILFLERDGWEAYMQKYTLVLRENGIEEYVYLPLSSKLSNESLQELSSCSGIIIGGGETEHYRNYIADTILGEKIKELYHQGVPVAGFSAGALISPENCVIPPIDNLQNKHLFLNGLGLIKNCVISVHFTKWNEKENIHTALKNLNLPIGYGIDDDAGIYFKNESLLETDGENVHIFEQVK